ncbi:MAG: hypothetical protein GY862_37100 [Gammaproteobacteria bacterium]|nr:hypothetical protein [Gammaproteobacteria bacterium]
MNKNLLVEIFADVGGGEGHIATGYPVAKERIITARHAIFPENRKPRAIELRWHHLEGAAKEWLALDPEECIVWDGGDGFDVAVIRAPFPADVKEWGRLSSERKPEDNMNWTSEGFARAGKKQDGTRKPVGMLGDVFAMADNAGRFELGVQYPVKQDADWQGASGSPVFVDNEIIGIIESCPKNFNAARLHAVPVWKLLEQESFRRALGIEEEERERKARACDELRRILKRAEKEARDLAGRLGLDWNQPHAIADALLSSNPASFTSLNRIFVEIAKSGNEPLVQLVRELLAVILPVRLEPGIIRSIRSQQSDIQCITVSMPVATLTGAEMAMAGADKRAAEFHIIGDRHNPAAKSLKALLAVDLPPETGIDSDGAQFMQAFQEDLIRKTAVRKDLALNQRIPYEELIKAAADELRLLAEEDHRTHYFIYALPYENKERYAQLIEKLKKNFSSVVFVNLIGRELTRERRDYRPLRKIWGME